MNFRQLFTRMFAAAAPAPAPARYQYLTLHNNLIDSNDASLGKAGPRSHLPPIEERQCPVDGVISVPFGDLGFAGAMFKAEAAELERQYEMRKAGIKSRRPETNADSLR